MAQPFSIPANAAQAIAMQQQLRSMVRLEDSPAACDRIAGLDVGYDPPSNQSHAVAVLMHAHDLRPIAIERAQMDTPFPYIPGLLSFREIPALLAVLEKLPQQPDLLMVDGQGVAHPRRLGIAAHLGVVTGLPSIGVAKSKLVGHYRDLGNEIGATALLQDQGETIGMVLRSKASCLPLFVSAGHRISQQTALAITRQCLRGYRLPEPTRIADKYSKRALRAQQPTLF